ncbi:MAG: sce7726 family protein [Lachnospiraceae bacterium]|nr:sce7726 family protein [Lachnospiraceae bacterium]
MDENGIRSVLTSYLRAKNPKLRIYKEKSIGGSICDVMVVTDILTGYEIKSDRDNYSRLDRQIVYYNWFFNEIYIVVGESHEQSASTKVPLHWGIMEIASDKVVLKRKAKPNPYYQAKRQLFFV